MAGPNTFNDNVDRGPRVNDKVIIYIYLKPI